MVPEQPRVTASSSVNLASMFVHFSAIEAEGSELKPGSSGRVRGEGRLPTGYKQSELLASRFCLGFFQGASQILRGFTLQF